VQLGCLKEENFQLKKEKEESVQEYQERLMASYERQEEEM